MGKMQAINIFAQTPPRIPAEEVSQGACNPGFAADISASAGRGYPKKVGAKTQVKKLLELAYG